MKTSNKAKQWKQLISEYRFQWPYGEGMVLVKSKEHTYASLLDYSVK